MDPAELERLVDRALGQLPAPRAPRTLLPRVMAAVPTPARPWHARPWLMWPAGWQIISLVVGRDTGCSGRRSLELCDHCNVYMENKRG